MITGTAKTWSAEGVAFEIVQGIKKKSFAITPGLEMKLIGNLHSLLGPGINWYMDRIIAKTRRSSILRTPHKGKATETI